MANKNVEEKIIVGINHAESRKAINADLKKILTQITDLEAKIKHAKLDKTATEELQRQLGNLTATINVSNIKVNQNQILKPAQQAAEKIGKDISGNVEKAISNAEPKGIRRFFRKDPYASIRQEETEKPTSSFLASFKNGFSFLKYWISASFLAAQAESKIKLAFTELKNVNSIMTEISNGTEMTTAQLKKLGSEAYEAAGRYGRTISDYLTGIQEMSRAGFQGDKAKEMAELSVLAQTAGGISAELSNEYLIAANAAYKLNGEAGKLNAVLDGQNNVADRNAVSMEQLANATKAAASQAADAGVGVNEMTAAVGVMAAATQQSGEAAGHAFKAVLMNLQQVSGELDGGEAIDEDSFIKFEKACNDLGVSLKTVKDGIVSLREPMEILQELAAAYASLDEMDARRANLTTAIGGGQRGNQLNALLENWEAYEKMLADFSQGSGSAMKEAMKSADSWEGSLNRLQNTWVNTVENITNSNTVITIIKGANSLLDVLNKLTSKLGSIGSIGLGTFALINKGRSNDFALHGGDSMQQVLKSAKA